MNTEDILLDRISHSCEEVTMERMQREADIRQHPEQYEPAPAVSRDKTAAPTGLGDDRI